jgi:hypothetical protein
MFAEIAYETDKDTEKVAATNNIITLVRASQKNKVPINYEQLIDAAKKNTTNEQELTDMKTLLYQLRDTNPY